VKIVSWNVNSIRARVEIVRDFLTRVRPDVLAMQETKVADHEFPTEEFTRLGYAVAFAGQRTYNGVAIASRLPMSDVCVGLFDDGADAERRLIAATIAGVRVMSAYVPNGKAVDLPSFRDKLRWLERLRITLDTRSEGPDAAIALCGDFNVAREDRDVHAPERLRGRLHFHPEEHKALAHLLEFGLFDSLRERDGSPRLYSWWDYRGGDFRENRGLRIDYVFVTAALRARLREAGIDTEPRKLDKPSDHAPVWIEIEDANERTCV
jgi:exodeoxyribonuclease-3